MIVAAFCYAASWWWAWPDNWQIGPFPLISFLFGYWWFAVGGVVLMRFPEQVLARRHEQVYFFVLAGWIVGLKLFIAAVSEPEWSGWPPSAWWPVIAPDRELFRTATTVFWAGTAALALVLPMLLVLKLRRSRGLERADKVPAATAAIAISVLGGGYLFAVLFHVSDEMTDALRSITQWAALTAPVAFLVSLAQRRVTPSSVIGLTVAVAESQTLAAVQRALRDAINDPSLVLAVRAGSPGYWVTCAGLPLTNRESDAWPVPVRDREGRHLAMLLVDPTLHRRADLVHGAAAVAGLALENNVLHADLAAQLAEVQASRRRITEANLVQRRRLERDLHDGAQQALLAAVSSLGAARIQAQDGRNPLATIDAAQADLRTGLAQLRDLARGLHPAVLQEHGLGAALRAVTERLPVPVALRITAERFPGSVESTVYFVVCEALANTVRHAEASAATVAVDVDRSDVTAVITDDGRGGARADGGSGLAGLADRVQAFGGSFEVDSVPGVGTRVVVNLPRALP